MSDQAVMTPCREWQGRRNDKDYGKIDRQGRTWSVHRWVWTLVYGQIPDGLHLCHHCDNPACFRIDHLFLGTNSENQLDSSAKGRHNQARKTHCPQGHPYDDKNTYIDGTGRRHCRPCACETQRRYDERKRA